MRERIPPGPSLHLLQVEKLNGICSFTCVNKQSSFFWSATQGKITASSSSCGPNEFFRVRFSKPKFITIGHRNLFVSPNEELTDIELSDSSAECKEFEFLPFEPAKAAPNTI